MSSSRTVSCVYEGKQLPCSTLYDAIDLPNLIFEVGDGMYLLDSLRNLIDYEDERDTLHILHPLNAGDVEDISSKHLWWLFDTLNRVNPERFDGGQADDRELMARYHSLDVIGEALQLRLMGKLDEPGPECGFGPGLTQQQILERDGELGDPPRSIVDVSVRHGLLTVPRASICSSKDYAEVEELHMRKLRQHRSSTMDGAAVGGRMPRTQEGPSDRMLGPALLEVARRVQQLQHNGDEHFQADRLGNALRNSQRSNEGEHAAPGAIANGEPSRTGRRDGALLDEDDHDRVQCASQ